MNKRCVVGSLLVLLAGVGVSCAGEPSSDVLVDSALLQLIEQADVPARAAGVLSTVDTKEGDLVTVGARLAQLDDEEANLIYQRAMIELELSAEKAANDVAIRSADKTLGFTRAEIGRRERAAANLPGSVSQSELEETRLKADHAELDLEQARHESRINKLTEKLKQQELALGKHAVDVRKIAAPINGVVVEVLRHVGEWVEPGDKVMRIVRIDRLRAEGLVNVRNVTANMKGTPVIIVVAVPGQNDVRCPGEIVFVSPEVNPVNGLVRISAEFQNPDSLLKPGLRAQIAAAPREAHKRTVSATPGDY